MKYLILLLLLIPNICQANTEISNAGTNIGIGTNSQSNALSINNTLAIGGPSYTSTSAPNNGVIIQGNVGIGSNNPGQALDVQGTIRTSNNIYYSGRIVKRTTTYASATSITPNSDTDDISYMANTQGAGTFTVNNDSGVNQTNGQVLILKISSTAVQTFSWGIEYDGGSIGLPSATLGTSTVQYYSFIWDSVNSKWDFSPNPGSGF